jgi:phosphatidylinositol glycan class M
VLALLYFAEQRRWDMAALALGLGVHLRLYPVVFGLPLILKIANLAGIARFAIISGGLFLGLLALFWYLYGWTFVFETYLYHFVRKDHRHNFSLFFYPIYLLSDYPELGKWMSLVTFIPQVVSLTLVGCMQRPLPVIALVQTLIFVAFNKVITAQYFTWFLCLLPLAVPHMKQPWRLGGLMVFWLLTELHWLFWGYHLEIEGKPVFLGTFWASVVFFISHIILICFIITATKTSSKKKD